MALEYARRAAGLSAWCYGVWLLLTWTATGEQLVFGAALSVATGVAMAPLGTVVGPWRLCAPRRAWALALLAGRAAGQIVRANVSLARRIWTPSLPLRSGMIIVPTTAATDGELAGTALITSLVVDNQFVDLDRGAGLLQYHAVDVPQGDRVSAVNGPIERRVAKVARP